MASSSGNSSTGTVTSQPVHCSGSEGKLTDQRKRKRMQSNRESARRSRVRKQNHVDDLTVEVARLSKDNGQILAGVNVTTQHLMAVEAQNQILRAQMVELNHRLHSLNEILNFIDTNSFGAFDDTDCLQNSAVADSFMNPFNMPYLNQPIMASADMFQY